MYLRLHRWLLMKSLIYLAAATGNGISNASKEFKRLVAAAYDKGIRPNPDGPPVNVTVQVSIVALGPINERTLTYDIDIFLRHFWKDPRIKFNFSKPLTYSGNPGDSIWIPDTYLPNAISIKTYEALTKSIRASISPTGDIYVSSRMLATCTCKMNLQRYPMDRQKCKLLLESYSYSGKDLRYYWIDKSPVEVVEGGIQVSGYEVQGIYTRKITRQYANSEEFSMLELSFEIKRTFSYYLYRSYLPSSILVVLTWGTFWIPSTAVPARITMIVTNFLSTIFILNNAGSQITKVPYNTAMEVYLSANAFFIIMVLAEFLLVLNFNVDGMSQTGKKKAERRNSLCLSQLAETDVTSPITSPNKQKIQSFRLLSVIVHYPIDSIAKVIFPVVYCIFLGGYFIHYSI